jgi:hypothetical protein
MLRHKLKARARRHPSNVTKEEREVEEKIDHELSYILQNMDDDNA